MDGALMFKLNVSFTYDSHPPSSVMQYTTGLECTVPSTFLSAQVKKRTPLSGLVLRNTEYLKQVQFGTEREIPN